MYNPNNTSNHNSNNNNNMDNLIHNFNYLQIGSNANNNSTSQLNEKQQQFPQSRYNPTSSSTTTINNTNIHYQSSYNPNNNNNSNTIQKLSVYNSTVLGDAESSSPTTAALNKNKTNSTNISAIKKQPSNQVVQQQQPAATSSSSPTSQQQRKTISYSAIKVIGNGSFGVVFLAKVQETGEIVAIKKVLQDKRFKNRELQVMKTLSHPNIVELKHYFYSRGDRDPDEVYLNLVLEYVPDTIYRFTMNYTKHNSYVPMIYVKLFVFQLLRSIIYIHSLGICHRDIKPQNLLIDPVTGVLKLCDFGNAKQLKEGEPNVSYICSRYYRAPELIFQSTKYNCAVDVWSCGCVMGELMLGSPLFQGESSVDQLVEIIKVLGTPSKNDILAMNKNYTEFKFPQVKPNPWDQVFADRFQYMQRTYQATNGQSMNGGGSTMSGGGTIMSGIGSTGSGFMMDPATEMNHAVDLITKLLQYDPKKRIPPMDALAHPFFDELRIPGVKLPNGKPLPPSLFVFSEQEFNMLQNPELKDLILPRSIQN
ncbi:hypothetical protein FDP41_012298 [Naegleria fowleri]|uniref:Protein kinase domain-containing protein n=1 Tax=Naegleria fowleri TaxID=5763 RepID=A0A6A5C3J5_NAEFO|nr:uncharacterized protein FDP41_012298 [Naegleria fowleri]KAF0981641.1 hypothetical protein FDP41_012298 [Naegleria fowleri]